MPKEPSQKNKLPDREIVKKQDDRQNDFYKPLPQQ